MAKSLLVLVKNSLVDTGGEGGSQAKERGLQRLLCLLLCQLSRQVPMGKKGSNSSGGFRVDFKEVLDNCPVTQEWSE